MESDSVARDLADRPVLLDEACATLSSRPSVPFHASGDQLGHLLNLVDRL